MQREHPSRVHHAPADRDYDNLTAKRARLEPWHEGGTNSEQLTDNGQQMFTSTSINNPFHAPQKTNLPASKPNALAYVKTGGNPSAEAQESEAEDEDTPTEILSVDDLGTEDLEEDTAEKELG